MLGDEALIGSALEMQGPALEEVLLDLRNERAMEVLWEEVAELDRGQTIALLYGAGHLPGLVTILESQGDWEVVDTKWLPAIELDLTTSPLTKTEVDMLRGWIRNFAKRLSPR
jgi:pheromone shutdown protein TraB